MHQEDSDLSDCPSKNGGEGRNGWLWKMGLLAAASTFWIVLRSGSKPTRIAYPCQQAALSNIQMFKLAVLAFIPSLGGIRSSFGRAKPLVVIVSLLLGSVFLVGNSIGPSQEYTLAQDDNTRVPLDLVTYISDNSISDLFILQNATGAGGDMDPAVDTLLDMMESEELDFYETASSPSGLIGSNDVIVLKVNGQWGSRGGTNTDLVKSVISAIVRHPDGFTGEIVVADNGQGLGNLNFYYANSFYHNQSIADVVNSFPLHNISTYLWDVIRYRTVDEYDEGDLTDGYVLSDVWNEETEIYVSYPKFRTTHGTYISFKNGVWESESGFDSDRLKVINMPVLKTHFRYGVTGCVKNYMGLPKGHIVTTIDYGIPHEHFSIGLGGMATLMVETRAPVLNILDMTWVNAHPMESSTQRGPWSEYSDASFTDIVGVSQDPVALDYWASMNILCATAEYLNYTEYSSLNPDYEPLSDQFYGSEPMDESFHNYLERSMNVLIDAGFESTMDDTRMNVYVAHLIGITNTGTTTPSDPTGPTGGWLDVPLTLAIVLPVAAAIVVLAAFIIKRRSA